MQKINTCLWFNMNAEEAVNFYTSIFKDSKITAVTRYGEGVETPFGPVAADTVVTISFQLNGMDFIALNGGPDFTFSEAISLVVNCDTQDEIDYYWDRLLEGGEPQACGWLKDKFGLSWQIVPSALEKMTTDADPVRVGRVNQAIFQMVKLDLPTLERAYQGQAERL